MGWNFHMSEAPKGETRLVTRKIGKKEVTIEEHFPTLIIAAGSDEVVTLSKWLPKEGRWSMFTKACPPMAWHPFPDHPAADGVDGNALGHL